MWTPSVRFAAISPKRGGDTLIIPFNLVVYVDVFALLDFD